MNYYIKVNKNGYIVNYKISNKFAEVKDPWFKVDFLSQADIDTIETSKVPVLKFNGMEIEKDNDAVIEDAEIKLQEEKIVKDLNTNGILLTLCDMVGYTDEQVDALRSILGK